MTHTIGRRLRNCYRALGWTARRAGRRPGAALRLEELDERILPDATPTLPYCFGTVLDRQHTDNNVNYVNGAWEFAANNQDDVPPTVTPLDDTLYYLNDHTQGIQPPGDQWNFLGAGANNPVWDISQDRQSGQLFLGFRSQDTEAGTFASYFESDPRVQSTDRWITVSLKEVHGPGTFSLFQLSPFGEPQTIWMSASEGNVHPTDKLFIPEGGHEHFNWGFSQPGVYQIVFTASGRLEGGGTIMSQDATWNFGVLTPDTPPVHTTPGNWSTPFQTPFVFSDPNTLSISTAEDHPCGINTTLSVDAGTLTLSQTTGLTFLNGTGTGDQTMTIEGSVDDINAALNGMVYTPDDGFSGDANFTITTDDMGRYAPYIDSMHTASNHQTTTDSFTISVQPGSAPTPGHGGPGRHMVEAGNALISGNTGNPGAVFDPLASNQLVQVTPVNPGSLTPTQLTVVNGIGSNVQNASTSSDAAIFSIHTDDLNSNGTGNVSASDPFRINVT